MTTRATQLADRIDQGAALLAVFARELSEEQWNTKVLPDGRTVGVLVHHVASMYPIEIGVIETALTASSISDVTWEVVAGINRDHAYANVGVTRADALDLLAKNSRAASDRVRQFTDAELDHALPFSLSYGAPVTVQYIIEDHPLRHPWHHLARMQRVLKLTSVPVATAA